MMIPMTSTHRRNAHKLMDFYYRPDIAAQVAAYVNYICPVTGAQEEMKKIDPELADSPLIFPTAQWIAEHNVKGFRALGAAEDEEYSRMWAKVVGN